MVGTLIVDSSVGDGVDCRVRVDSVADEVDVTEDSGEVRGVRL